MLGNMGAIPAGFNSITPYLVVDGVASAIEVYQKGLGAELVSSMAVPDSEKIMNAQLRIGNSSLMLTDEFPDYGVVGPNTIGGSSVTIHIYVEDADVAFAKAVAAGFEIIAPLADMFWGDRYGQLLCPFGHSWSIATQIAEVSTEEAIQAMMAGGNPEA